MHILELVLVFVLVYVVYVIAVVIQRLYLHPLSAFPGPRLAAATGWFEAYYDIIDGGTFVKQYEKWHARYGPVIRISPNHLHINDPNFYHEVFGIRTPYRKDPFFLQRGPSPTSVVALCDPKEHKEARNGLNPYFTKAYVAKMSHVVIEKVAHAVEFMNHRIKEGRVIDIQMLYRRIAMDIIQEALYGRSQNLTEASEDAPGILPRLEHFQADEIIVKHFPIAKKLGGIISFLTGGRLLSGYVYFHAKCHSWVTETMSEYKKGDLKTADGRHTLFAALVESNDKRTSKETHDHLLQSSFLFLVAGTDSPAYSMSSATYYILSNPEVMHRLQDELRQVPTDAAGNFQWKDLALLPYLTAVIQESLRLSTAIPGNLPRLIPPNGATVNGIFLPGGTSVSLANRVMHNNPTVFPSPQTFDPNRWLGEQRRESEKWQFSFSKGPHRCIGMNLAYLEMYVCLATFFARFDMELFETNEATMDWTDRGISCLKSTVKVTAKVH